MLAFSFCMFWAWQTSVSFSPTLNSSNVIDSPWYLSNAFMLGLYVVATIFAKSLQGIASSFASMVSVAVIQLISTGLQLLLIVNPELPAPFFFIRLALTSIGVAGFVLIGFTRLALIDEPMDRCLLIAVGKISSQAIYLCLLCIGQIPCFLVTLVLPVLTFVCASLFDRLYTPETVLVSKEQSVASDEQDMHGKRPISIQIVGAIFIFGMSLNFVRMTAEAHLQSIGPFIPVVAAWTVLLLALAFTIEILSNRSMFRVVPTILVVAITIAILLAVLGISDSSLAVYTLANSAYLYFATLLWRVPVSFAQIQPNRSARVVFSIFAANAAGLLVGQALFVGVSSLTQSQATVASMLIAYVVLFAGVALMKTRQQAPSVTPNAVGTENHIHDLPSLGLSDREVEMLSYLLSTMSLREIADEMNVSINTVKTHTSHIYQKLGIHSRLELAELIRNDAGSNNA